MRAHGIKLYLGAMGRICIFVLLTSLCGKYIHDLPLFAAGTLTSEQRLPNLSERKVGKMDLYTWARSRRHSMRMAVFAASLAHSYVLIYLLRYRFVAEIFQYEVASEAMADS